MIFLRAEKTVAKKSSCSKPLLLSVFLIGAGKFYKLSYVLQHGSQFCALTVMRFSYVFVEIRWSFLPKEKEK